MTAARCPTCDREECPIPAAAQALDAAQVPVTPDKNGCDCYGGFSRSHNPARGCQIHGDREYQTRCFDLSLAWRAATDDCRAHAVDWRARALAAEARIACVTATIEHDIAICRYHQAARATGGQTCGTGGALTAAQPSMLAYLERVVRDLHDERTRAVAADAAKWQRVAPLIERLRDARYGCTADGEHDATTALLDATTDRASAPEGATP